MASVNLDLSQAATGSTALNFGANTPPPDNPNATATADITLAELITDAHVVLGSIAHSDMPMADITIDASTAYLVNVFRGITANPTAVFAQATRMWQLLRSQWAPYTRPASIARIPWQRAIITASQARSKWVYTPRLNASTGASWQQAEPIKTSTQTGWRYPPKQNQSRTAPWQQATATTATAGSTWRYPPRVRNSQALVFEQATPASATQSLVWFANPTARRFEPRIPWQQATPVISLWPRPDRYTPEPPPQRIITPNLALLCPVDGTGNLKFGFVCGQGQEQIIIPIQRAYIVIHDIEVQRLPDNFSIQASKIAINYDADTWAWGWSATLLGREALDAVLPSALGEPVTLAVNINGHIWHLVVEEWSESREFGKRGVSVKGRGLSSFLASPYLLPTSGVTTADRTLQQLMADHLPIDSGASLTWATGMADWLVPAGAWSWNNQAPINAIQAAAQGVGMVIVPGMASRVLHIQPRYPVMPWDFSSATPSIIVPDAVILSANRRQAVPTQANAVYVHGGEVGGILARVKRSGSAGDRVAATASSSLITTADAARFLGSRLLAAQNQQPELRDITMPMGGVFSLASVGQLISATLDGTEYRGIVNSVGIDASLSNKSVTVRQTLTLGDDTTNTWSRFKKLLPSDPLLIGNIEQIYTDGSATITLIGGGSMRVRGTGTTGQTVYVRQGMIEGQAPSLPQLEIEV